MRSLIPSSIYRYSVSFASKIHALFTKSTTFEFFIITLLLAEKKVNALKLITYGLLYANEHVEVPENELFVGDNERYQELSKPHEFSSVTK